MSASGRIVIVGGGVIGTATAYYLSTHLGLGEHVTLVEQTAIASAASGKAAGFLALDWNDRSPVGPLSRKSFQLHQELATTFGPDTIQYRPLVGVWSASGALRSAESNSIPIGTSAGGIPAWLDKDRWTGTVVKAGNEDTAAQVHPRLLCEAMVAAAKGAGCTVVTGKVNGLSLSNASDEGARCTAVLIDGDALPCETVVLCMGPWTERAREWLPSGALPQVIGLRRSSVVLRPRVAVPAEACLLHDESGEWSVYPRPDGTVYISGLTEDAADLPPTAEDVQTNRSYCGAIAKFAAAVCPDLSEEASELQQEQSCYMPFVGHRGLPLIGAVPYCVGVFVGTGHGPWGILNGPATGLALAELASGSACTQDVTPFDPRREEI